MGKSSAYRGVTLFRPTGKWRAQWDLDLQISANGRTTSLGDHDTQELAAAAFDRAALNKDGAAARTNFEPTIYASEMAEISSMTFNELVAELRARARKNGAQSSRYRGVSLLRQTGRWHAQINAGGKQVHLGFFSTEVAAARAYDRAAIAKAASCGEIAGVQTNFDLSQYMEEVEDVQRIKQQQPPVSLAPFSRCDDGVSAENGHHLVSPKPCRTNGSFWSPNRGRHNPEPLSPLSSLRLSGGINSPSAFRIVETGSCVGSPPGTPTFQGRSGRCHGRTCSPFATPFATPLPRRFVLEAESGQQRFGREATAGSATSPRTPPAPRKGRKPEAADNGPPRIHAAGRVLPQGVTSPRAHSSSPEAKPVARRLEFGAGVTNGINTLPQPAALGSASAFLPLDDWLTRQLPAGQPQLPASMGSVRTALPRIGTRVEGNGLFGMGSPRVPRGLRSPSAPLSPPQPRPQRPRREPSVSPQRPTSKRRSSMEAQEATDSTPSDVTATPKKRGRAAPAGQTEAAAMKAEAEQQMPLSPNRSRRKARTPVRAAA